MNKRYISIFLAFTMLLSIFTIYFVATTDPKYKEDSNDNSTSAENGNQTYSGIPYSYIPGKHVQHELNSIADGLHMSPQSPLIVRYVDIARTKGTPLESVFGNQTVFQSVYGADVTKRYSAEYGNGSGFELHQVPEQTIAPPVYTENYSEYTLLSMTNQSDFWTAVGAPVILGPKQSVKGVIDVLDGNSTGSSNFDYLLSHVDSSGTFFQEIIAKSNLTDIPADQYYLDFKKLDNGSYTATSAYINPEDNLTAKINTMAANASERNASYSVAVDGNVTKLVITSNFADLNKEIFTLMG